MIKRAGIPSLFLFAILLWGEPATDNNTYDSQVAVLQNQEDETISERQMLDDSIFIPVKSIQNREGCDLVAVPNPVREHHEKMYIMCQTRCMGRALVNIYDATGSMVFETTADLQQPDAVGYKMCVPWDCRNRSGRKVGKGTYLAVVRIFDTEERMIARRQAHVGITY